MAKNPVGRPRISNPCRRCRCYMCSSDSCLQPMCDLCTNPAVSFMKDCKMYEKYARTMEIGRVRKGAM
jgi:hypothetical protein